MRMKKHLDSFILSMCGLLPLKKAGVIFVLHRVLPASSPGSFDPLGELSITPEFLDLLLDYLREHKVPILSLEEALDEPKGPFVAFTIDDGYRDNYEIAFPIFLKHFVPFTVFLTTGLIDRSVPMWWFVLKDAITAASTFQLPDSTIIPTKTLAEKDKAFGRAALWFRDATPYGSRKMMDKIIKQYNLDKCAITDHGMTWDMIREMHDSGLVSFGCHTITHPTMSILDKRTIIKELMSSRMRIRTEVATPKYFAYPYGNVKDISPLAMSVVNELGFDAAFTTYGGPITDKPYRFAVPRIDLSDRDQSISRVNAHRKPFTYKVMKTATDMKELVW